MSVGLDLVNPVRPRREQRRGHIGALSPDGVVPKAQPRDPTVAMTLVPSPSRQVMQFLHTMLRVRDLDVALDFWVNKLGLVETRRRRHEQGRFTLVFLATEPGAPEIELTHNWDQTEPYPTGRFFGHLAFRVADIYATCARLEAAGVQILRPPRDGYMAFVASPDGHSVELLQAGEAQAPAEPWVSRPNVGSW